MRLVIDATLAQSIRSASLVAPRAVLCRDILLAILDHKHVMVLTKEIDIEWDAHVTKFTRKWRVTMKSRRQMLYLRKTVDASLREEIRKKPNDTGKIKVMLKDVILIEAAQNADYMIISFDKKAKNCIHE